LEAKLREVLARKRTFTGGATKKALQAEVLQEAKAEVGSLKKKLAESRQQALNLRKRARSLSRWITNPARMVWLKVAELHRRDRLEAALRTAEARLRVRQEWLRSIQGTQWLDQQRRAPEWRELRTEERRLRRHVRRAERRAAGALDLASQADGLAKITYGRVGLLTEIDLPNQSEGGTKYLREMQTRVQETVQALPPQLRSKLIKGLGKGRGQAD
jgi:hypothetical protein